MSRRSLALTVADGSAGSRLDAIVDPTSTNAELTFLAKLQKPAVPGRVTCVPEIRSIVALPITPMVTCAFAESRCVDRTCPFRNAKIIQNKDGSQQHYSHLRSLVRLATRPPLDKTRNMLFAHNSLRSPLFKCPDVPVALPLVCRVVQCSGAQYSNTKVHFSKGET